jgi:effector-binding domain-containing protein
MRILNSRQPILFAVILLLAPIPLAAQQSPAPAEQATPAEPAPSGAAPESAIADNSVKEENVPPHAALETRGAAKLEQSYTKIVEAVTKLRAAAQKAGLKESGRPLVVFADAANGGDELKFDVMLPVDAPADAKPALDAGVALAQTPGGKALRFEHRGPYDDIDSTYDAISAYLDAKNLEAGNVYAEEFLNDAKDADDVKLQVDIHVFMK